MTQQTNSKINFALHRNQGKLYLAAAVFFSTLGVNAVAADVWTTCANEGSTCNFSGIKQVRYGANGIYAYKTATGSIGCNNETFGDPVYGVVKQCSIVTSTTSPGRL